MAHATLNVRITDLAEFKGFVDAVVDLIEALEEDLDEPFTMAPMTQDRLRERVAAVRDALKAE